MDMTVYKSLALALTLVLMAGCASTKSVNKDNSPKQGASYTKTFNAHSVFYTRAPTPKVWEKKFRSVVDIRSRKELNSYRFSNYLDKDDKEPGVIVVLAISGSTAGLGIYDSNDRPLAEFPKGTVSGSSVQFTQEEENGKISIKWFISSDSIVSMFETYGKDGLLGRSEVTFYNPKSSAY